jgi:hypothetical protein
LVKLATAVEVVGLLFAQMKGTDHTPDLVIWSFATILLVAASLLAWLKEPNVVDAAPGWLITIFFELALSVCTIIAGIRDPHSA